MKTFTTLAASLLDDEAGFIVSAELILIATIVVLGLVVGLSELSHNVNEELEDVGSAIASINQSFKYCGNAGHKGQSEGSQFTDYADHCDGQWDIVSSGFGSEH